MTVLNSCQQARNEFRIDLVDDLAGKQTAKPVKIGTLHIAETGSDITFDDHGTAWIQRKSPLLPGTKLTLQLNKLDLEKYRIFSPLLGEATVPLENSTVLKVTVLPKGSPLFLSNRELETLLSNRFSNRARTAPNLVFDDGSTLRQNAPPAEMSVLDRMTTDLAAEYGTTRSAIIEFIKRWQQEVRTHGDQREIALAAMVDQDFDKAEKILRSGGADSLELLGDGLFAGTKYSRAITAYRDALTILGNLPQAEPSVLARCRGKLANTLMRQAAVSSADPLPLLNEALALSKAYLTAELKQSDPKEWALYQYDAASVLLEQASRKAGTESEKLILQAIDSLHQALGILERDKFPRHWASTNELLAYALLRASKYRPSEPARSLLNDAMACLEQAQEAYPRKEQPLQWARLEASKGNLTSFAARQSQTVMLAVRESDKALAFYRAALEVLGPSEEKFILAAVRDSFSAALNHASFLSQGEKARKLVLEAITVSQETLRVTAPWSPRDEHARRQYSLACALTQKAAIVPKEEADSALVDAITVFREVILVVTRDRSPEDWAEVQNSLGVSLLAKARLRSRDQQRDRLINEAKGNFEAALTVLTRESRPERWAAINSSLGGAFMTEGSEQDFISATAATEKAVEVFRRCLDVYSEERYPNSWAETQSNLSKLYWGLSHTKATAVDSIALAEQAIKAAKGALRIFSREENPRGWAFTKYNLGVSLLRIADYGTKDYQTVVEEAVSALRSAFEVRRKLGDTSGAAWSQSALSDALGRQAELKRSPAVFQESVDNMKSALQFFTQDQFPDKWIMGTNGIALTLLRWASLPDADHPDKLCEEAIACVRPALEFMHTRLPGEWAKAQSLIGDAMKRLDFLKKSQGTDMLAEAIAAYTAALTVRTPQWKPLRDRSYTLYQLGGVWWILSTRVNGDESQEACHKALDAARESLNAGVQNFEPNLWYVAQRQLCYFLLKMAEDKKDENPEVLLNEAIAKYQELLQAFGRESHQDIWTDLQNSLGAAWAILGKLHQGDQAEKCWLEADAAFRRVLEVADRVKSPVLWAYATGNRGELLKDIAKLKEGKERETLLKESQRMLSEALMLSDVWKNADPKEYHDALAEVTKLLGQ